MLNARFENFHIIFSFVEKEKGVVVRKYDTKSLYPMLVKCHEHFHPLIEFKRSFVIMIIV